MSKSQDAKKETKKKPLLSAKDKRSRNKRRKIVTVDASAQGPLSAFFRPCCNSQFT